MTFLRNLLNKFGIENIPVAEALFEAQYGVKAELSYIEYEVVLDKLYLFYEEKCSHDHPGRIHLTFYEKDLIFKKIGNE